MWDNDGSGFALRTDFVDDPAGLLQLLLTEVAWTQQMRSRHTASMGIPYNYAGASYPEAPWHPAVRALADQVGRLLDFEVTNGLLNHYPTGEHTIGWHTDDVTILAPHTPIVILSFGATRTLLLRSGTAPDFRYERIALPSGSLFVMGQALQATHKHAIKREVGKGARVSLTLRHLTHAPPPVERAAWGQSEPR